MSEELSWGRSTVDTSCPLDCPDACSLAVSVEQGKVTKIDGSRRHDITNGFICAKVRGFAGRVYGNDRLQFPADPHRPQGQGPVPPRVVERGARRHRQPHRRGAHAQRRRGDPPLLLRRLERPADAGSRRRALLPPPRRVAAGAHGVRRADRRRRARPLRQDVRRRLRGLPRRAADRAVGRQSVGVRHPSRALRARGAAQGRDADRRRSAAHGARASRPTCTSRCGRAPTCRSRSPCTASCSRTGSPTRRSCAITRPASPSCAPPPRRGRSPAPPPSPASSRRRSSSSPASTPRRRRR